MFKHNSIQNDEPISGIIGKGGTTSTKLVRVQIVLDSLLVVYLSVFSAPISSRRGSASTLR